MAKKEFEVDRAKLVAALNEAEKNGPLKNLDALWKAAETIYNLQVVPRLITFSVIALRAKAWKLDLKTKPGKRGRGVMTPEQIAAMQAGRGQRVPRAERFKVFHKEFEAMKRDLPEHKHPLIDRAAAGSAMAALSAHCYSCAGNSNKEARLCLVWDCKLYHPRPGAMPYAQTKIEVDKQVLKEMKEEDKKAAA